MEKAKEVVGTIDRVHQLSLHVPGVGANLQIATVLALRELLFVVNFNDVVHFLVVRVVYTIIEPTNSLLRSVNCGIRILNYGFRVSFHFV
jgi:hypothetical protein